MIVRMIVMLYWPEDGLKWQIEDYDYLNIISYRIKDGYIELRIIGYNKKIFDTEIRHPSFVSTFKNDCSRISESGIWILNPIKSIEDIIQRRDVIIMPVWKERITIDWW
jgi:hypothetical protein